MLSKGVLAIPSRVIATCFALIGFAAAVIVGLAASNSSITILWRALAVMILCWIVGRPIGALTQRSVEAHIAEYKQRHPIPGDGPAIDSRDGRPDTNQRSSVIST